MSPTLISTKTSDLMLWFCIWGEAANLRHLPECLCFLFHKCSETYNRFECYQQQQRSLYPGHFLDNCITPIYAIIQKNLKSPKDHQERKNYDDMNEFFWNPSCLDYHYRAVDVDTDDHLVEDGYGRGGVFESPLPPIAVGLQSAPKTFLEKRSHLRAVLALSRLIEFNVCSFFLLSVLAFANELVWDWVYFVHVLSGVFVISNFLKLTWTIIEIWSIYPSCALEGATVTGHLLSIVSRFLILVYQLIYLAWTFGRQGGGVGFEADSSFWWWQYVWISCILLVPSLFELFSNVWPVITTLIYTSEDDYVLALFAIFSPLSRLFVARVAHEKCSDVAQYLLFWGTLLAWKLVFSYYFEISVMTLPTLELVDDYVNYAHRKHFFGMVSLVIIRWLPQFLVFLIDTSIWYNVWSACVGSLVGFREHLGDIKSFRDVRDNFVRAPEAFCSKLLAPSAHVFPSSSALLSGMVSPSSSEVVATERTSLLGGGKKGDSDSYHRDDAFQSYVKNSLPRLLDVRVQKWSIFSEAWNEIIDNFRSEDIISNKEMGYLKFSSFASLSRPIYFPNFLLAGVIDDCLHVVEKDVDPAKVGGGFGGGNSDSVRFKSIIEDVVMSAACSEVWELGGFVLSELLGEVHQEDLVFIVAEVGVWFERGELSEWVNLKKLRSVISSLESLIATLLKGLNRRKSSRKNNKIERVGSDKKITKPQQKRLGRRSSSTGNLQDMPQRNLADDENSSTSTTAEKNDSGRSSISIQPVTVILDSLRDQTREKIRGFCSSLKSLLNLNSTTSEVLDRLTFVLSVESGFIWNDEYATTQLDTLSASPHFFSILSHLHGVISALPEDVEPRSVEAKRRLAFFVNSLFMDIPRSPGLTDMLSMSVLTPFYSEDVTLAKSDLEARPEKLGVSVLLYLQTLYRNDWTNYLERLQIKDNEEKVWSKKFLPETRRWASMRAQTLERTVTGMMQNEKALRLLAKLEKHDDETVDALLGEKFSYVVTCQIYGAMKKNQDSKADDIDALMHRFPHLRVAYIDSQRLNRSGDSVYYSVLVKSTLKSDGSRKIQEVYRVRLPGNPVIGEGKPENQNHAIIFTRGEKLQTIDMNQEGYFEECLKMRNVLEEFSLSKRALPMTILGLREHIFTGSVSSLANYMAMQETSFVTLGQRVLTKPLCSRLHYGHPDVFDKLWFMTRGGVSKASKGINLSEDIFAGYNGVIRGGVVGFKEYVQVGKGRDVGAAQIFKFESKLAQGNAEQSLSRDLYRLCHRLDFGKLLSTFWGGIGFYIGCVLTISAVFLVTYLMLGLALYDCEKIGDRKITPMGGIQMILGGMGLLNTFPLLATLGVERGWGNAFAEIVSVFATGGVSHFIFHLQTRSHYYLQTILVGGAKYRATGRGFVTQHTPFDENFRFFASSHFYLGAELAVALTLMGLFSDADQYGGRTWSLWLVVFSFLAAPFWFNPNTFVWSTVRADYGKFCAWASSSSGNSERSWSAWNDEECSYYATLPLSSKIVYAFKAALHIFTAEGIRRSTIFSEDLFLNTPVVPVTTLVFIIVVGMLLRLLFSNSNTSYPIRRTVTVVLSSTIFVGIGLLMFEFTDIFRYSLVAYYTLAVVAKVGLMAGLLNVVKPIYLMHDLLLAHVIFSLLHIAAALQIVNTVQTWLLYNSALGSNVVIEDILRFSRKSQEKAGSGDEELESQVSELRRLILKQDIMLQNMEGAKGGRDGKGGAPRGLNESSKDFNASTDALVTMVGGNRPNFKKADPSDDSDSHRRPPPRVHSMTSMDIWSSLALGGVEGGIDMGPAETSAQVAPMSPPRTDFNFSQPAELPPRRG